MDALPLFLESKEKLSEIPEAYRPLYVEKDGKLSLDVAPRRDIGRFLDSKRQAEADAAKTRETFEGLDPTEAREAVALKRRLEEKKLLEKGDFEGVLARREAEAKASATKEKEEALALKKAAEDKVSVLLLDRALLDAAAALDVADPDDLLLAGQRAFKVVGGDIVGPNGPTNAEGVKAWAKELLEKKKHWLKPSSGAGTPPKGGPGGPPTSGLLRSKMSHEEKAAYQKKHGIEAYNKLPL